MNVRWSQTSERVSSVGMPCPRKISRTVRHDHDHDHDQGMHRVVPRHTCSPAVRHPIHDVYHVPPSAFDVAVSRVADETVRNGSRWTVARFSRPRRPPPVPDEEPKEESSEEHEGPASRAVAQPIPQPDW